MKTIYTVITVSLLLFFTSCGQDEQPIVGQGYLSLMGIEVQAVEIEVVTTRAVDEDFTIEVYKEGETTATTSLTYTAAQTAGSKIALEAGSYYLKVYNAAYGSSDYSKPVYFYQSEAFTIEADWVTYVDAVVPMINFGVRFSLPENFDNFFTSYTLTVTDDTGRSVSLTDENTVAYFSNAATSFSYTLVATNTDGEQCQKAGNTSVATVDGTVYKVVFEYATQSLYVR